jgi:hypothetical protein
MSCNLNLPASIDWVLDKPGASIYVSVKLSSSPTYSLKPYPHRDMTAHIRRLFEAYGPWRCYWGTDITNSLAKATYRQRITHFTETLDFLTEEDKDWVTGRAILERLKWA